MTSSLVLLLPGQGILCNQGHFFLDSAITIWDKQKVQSVLFENSGRHGDQNFR